MSDNITYQHDEYSYNIPWEQVLYFLKKKDVRIDTLKEKFWSKDRTKKTIWKAFEEALIKETYIKEVEFPIKKNETNTNYDILRIEKEDDSLTYYLNDEETTLNEIIDLFEADDIIALQYQMIDYFEKEHEDRDKKMSKLHYNDEYLARLLNPNQCIK